MSQGIRVRLAKLERAPLYRRGRPLVGALSLVLKMELNEVLRVSENSEDRQAAAELLQYEPDSIATFAALSNQSLSLATRLLSELFDCTSIR